MVIIGIKGIDRESKRRGERYTISGWICNKCQQEYNLFAPSCPRCPKEDESDVESVKERSEGATSQNETN